MIRLDRAAAEPLHQQLYRQIRDELAAGISLISAQLLRRSREARSRRTSRLFADCSLQDQPWVYDTWRFALALTSEQERRRHICE